MFGRVEMGGLEKEMGDCGWVVIGCVGECRGILDTGSVRARAQEPAPTVSLVV